MARRSVAEFLQHFVLPLVRGGPLRVGRPLDPDDLRAFEDDLPHASVELVAVDEARTAVLSELVVRPPALVLDADELRLAAALHNVLFLVHPRADEVWVSARQLRRVATHAQELASQPLRPHRRRLLARHALLHNVFNVRRTDLRVSWWTGSAQFFGQEPPSRLTSWKAVRRVQEETSVATYGDLLASPEAQAVMATLLRRSPITQLCSDHPSAPALHWEDATPVLRDLELARAVAYQVLRGSDPEVMAAAPARLAAAFEQLLERHAPEEELRVVVAFLVHLNVLLAVGELRQRNWAARSPLLTRMLAAERAGQRPRGLTTFLALPNAMAAVDARVALPPGLLDEPMLRRRWQAHRRQVAEELGEAFIEALHGRLRRHFTPPVSG